MKQRIGKVAAARADARKLPLARIVRDLLGQDEHGAGARHAQRTRGIFVHLRSLLRAAAAARPLSAAANPAVKWQWYFAQPKVVVPKVAR